jgi:subtilase family serine protease
VETRLLRPGSRLLCLLLVLAAVPAFSQQFSQAQALITQPIDESYLTTLKGNTHPLAQSQFDIGIAAPNLPLQRMLLVLKRGPQQDFALRKLLDEQQDKASPNYHQWVTPDEFGVQFGPSDVDVQQVTGWLQSHGFQVNRVAHGRGVIEFSGVEFQVESAFHTQIHAYMVNGQQHWANASDPQIPVALAPAVAGVLSLNNFPAQPMLHNAGAMSRDKSSGQITPVKPSTTLNGNCGVQNHCYGVGPYDFATIYNVAPLWNATPAIDGTGQTIAIVGETDINPQDVADFRNYFGLPPVTLNVIHDGPAPGILSNGEETESDLDVEWSSAVAKGATIDFVVAQSTETTPGIDLAALYIIDNNLAPVMSESYGFCELGLGTAGNQAFNAMWEQAAAQGITVMISAGDNGAAGCDNFNALGPAQFGLQVSGFASTPFNVAVGGTDFYDLTNASLYWNNSNASTTQASAISYIPETTWDDSCTNPVFGVLLGFSTNAETNCNNGQLIQFGFVNVIGGSGGKSNCTTSNGQNPSSCAVGYPKPSWQVGPGVPADGVRDIPDVSLFAASGSPSGSFYIVCEADQVSGSSCDPTNPNTQFIGIGGTSASAPAFAGVMALVNQQNPTPHGQGNANYVLYKLAAQQNAASCNSTNGSGASCVFNDVTTGTIAMPCAAGSPDCTVNTPGHQYGILNGYSTGTAYDLATGLGSVNVKNLVTKWNTATFRSSATTLALGPPTSGITHGQAVNVNIGVAPGSGGGTPTGDVSLLTSTGVGVDGFTLSNGAVTGTTSLLPGGTYTVTAHYVGDSVFGGSDSTPVSVTIGKENSSPHIELVTFDWNGNLLSSNATTAVYGTPYLLRVDVFGNSGTPCLPSPLGGAACPSGNVALTDNNSPLDAGTYPLNSQGYTEDQTAQLSGGNNSVKAQYAGDSSFNASSKTTPLNITPAQTTISLPPQGCCFDVGGLYYGGATVQSQSNGATPTGSVTFYVNGNPLGGSTIYNWAPPSGNPPILYYYAIINSGSSPSPFPAPGTYSLTASYSGDANYQPSTSTPATFFVQFDPPTVNLRAAQNPINAGSSASLTATVLGFSKTIAPTGTISFYESNAGNLSGTVSYATVTDPTTGNLDLRGTISITPGFTDGYFANYSGDANYPANGTSAAIIVTVNGSDFVFRAQQSSASVIRGYSASYPLLVGFQSNTAPVSFTCSGLPNEATCNASPNPDPSTITVYLTISTIAPHYASAGKTLSRNMRYLWPVSLMPLSAFVLITYPRRRNWRLILRILLTGLLLLGLGCGGGGGSGGGGGGGGGGTPPAAPTSLTTTVVSSSQINLGWFPSAGATTYTVYRSTSSGFTPSSSNTIASGQTNSSFYADSGVSPSTTYYYVVKAANSSGLSAPSNQASGTTPAFDPGTPAGTYNITVAATSGSFSHNVNLTLVVQ